VGFNGTQQQKKQIFPRKSFTAYVTKRETLERQLFSRKKSLNTFAASYLNTQGLNNS